MYSHQNIETGRYYYGKYAFILRSRHKIEFWGNRFHSRRHPRTHAVRTLYLFSCTASLSTLSTLWFGYRKSNLHLCFGSRACVYVRTRIFRARILSNSNVNHSECHTFHGVPFVCSINTDQIPIDTFFRNTFVMTPTSNRCDFFPRFPITIVCRRLPPLHLYEVVSKTNFISKHRK